MKPPAPPIVPTPPTPQTDGSPSAPVMPPPATSPLADKILAPPPLPRIPASQQTQSPPSTKRRSHRTWRESLASALLSSTSHQSVEDDSDARSPLPPDTVLGSYTILSLLGRGGYGITYRARHNTKGTNVVIKEHMPLGMASREQGNLELIFPSHEAERQFQATLEEFLEEITVLQALENPGIVPIIDCFEANDTAYYVMPFISGTPLKPEEKISLDSTKRRREAARIKQQLLNLLQTLEYLENNHIIHRDIKPENILITSRGKPILLDFGSARQLQPGKIYTNVFTPDFCAPEQSRAASDAALSKAIGPWTDIYSLAATFYYIISRLAPPTSEVRSISVPDPYKPLAKRPELVDIYGSDFLAALDRGLQLTPANRWASATQWRESIEENDVTSPIPPHVMRNLKIAGVGVTLLLSLFGYLTFNALYGRKQLRSAYNNGLSFTEGLLHDFSTELVDIPGSIPLQRRMSANLQKYLDSMSKLPEGKNTRLDRAMAAAWFNIGCTYMSLGQLNDANAALLHASELETLISSKYPSDQRFHYELARTLIVRAELAERINNYDEAKLHILKAKTLLQDLYKNYPDNPDYSNALAEALLFEVSNLSNVKEHETRCRTFEQIIKQYDEQVKRFSRHIPSRMGRGTAYFRYGFYMKDIGMYSEAQVALRKSLRIFDRLIEQYPYRLSFKKGRAQVLYHLGEMYFYKSLESNNPKEKEENFRLSEQIFHQCVDAVRELRNLDHSNLQYLYFECRALCILIDVSLQRGETGTAEAESRSMLEKANNLLAAEPYNKSYVEIKARALALQALAHHALAHHAGKSAGELKQARDLLKSHLDSDAISNDNLFFACVEVLTWSASVALDDGDPASALRWLSEARTILDHIYEDSGIITPYYIRCKKMILNLLPRAEEQAQHGGAL